MAIRVVEFSNGGTKLETFLPKNQHTKKKIIEFLELGQWEGVKNWASF